MLSAIIGSESSCARMEKRLGVTNFFDLFMFLVVGDCGGELVIEHFLFLFNYFCPLV